jgi:hypothetical protein
VWTPFTITLPSVPVGSTGRIAFRYFVTDGGNLGDNSAYIGIDTVEYTAVVVPEPDFSTSLKISPASSTQGEAISYSIHIINTGSLAGLDTSMVDPIPLGANYNNDVICSAGTCGFNAVTNTVFWHGSVDAQEDVEVQFSVNPNPGLCGVIVNQATITDPEAPAPVTVEATTEVVGPALNFQNFEATNGGYSSISENTWSWGPPPAGLAPAHSGANVWATESPYVDFGDYLLVSGPINLAAADPNRLLMLQWWQKVDVEVNFDFAYVDISTNGGNTWTNLWEGDYHGSWEQISVDASSYKGQTVLLRFHLTTDDSVTYDGWAIDDVAFVSGCLPPVISIQPTSLTVSLAPDQQTTKQLNVCNHGEAPLSWTVNEVAPVLGMQSFTLLPFESVIVKGSDPLSAERAPRVYTKTTAPISEVFNNLMASQAYGIDVYNENLVTFNSDTPGNFTVIANLAGNAYFGGDFLNNDFSKLYVVDYSVNQLHTVNTTTGAVTVIGPAAPNPGQNWTGLTGAPDGTLYASAADCATTSSLYTVNPNTGVVTQVGPVTNATCLIDIAVNAEGEMYGVDIAFDNLVHIDKATGAGTVVGSVGIDANYAQGLDFDDGTGTLYWAAYNNSTLQGELRAIDITTGYSSLIGAFSGGVEVDSLAFATSAYDAPWLSEAPILGDILAGECSVVNVTFDSTGLSFGTYTSALDIKSNDPVMTVVNVPVTLYVNRNIYLPLVLKAP